MADYEPQTQMASLLSDREIEMVGHLAYGLSNKEIAKAMHVSPNTVKSHLLRVSAKLGTQSRAGVVGACYRNGWLMTEKVYR